MSVNCPLVFSIIPTDAYGNPFADGITQDTFTIQALQPDSWNLPNPYIAEIAGAGGASTQRDNPLLDSHEVISNADFLSIVMLCQTFVWDISYRSFNGTLIIEEANLSNLTVPRTVSGPVIDRGGLESLSAASLSSSLTISMVASTTVDEFLSNIR